MSTGWGARQSGSKNLSPLVNGKAYPITAFWRKFVGVGRSDDADRRPGRAGHTANCWTLSHLAAARNVSM